MTYGECKQQVLARLDELSRRGTALSTAEPQIQDYLRRMPYFADAIQRQILSVQPMLDTLSFYHQPPENLLKDWLPDQTATLTEQLTFTLPSEVNAYSFESDGSLTLNIQARLDDDSLHPLAVVTATSQLGFQLYRGRLSCPAGTQSLEVVITGGGRLRGPAFYQLIGGAEIPPFSDPIPYTLPVRVGRVREIEYNGLSGDAYVTWLSDRQLGVDYQAVGSYRLTYEINPESLTLSTPDSHPMEVHSDAYTALVAGTAALCLQYDDQAAFSQLYREFQGLLVNLRPLRTSRQRRISNRLFGGV